MTPDEQEAESRKYGPLALLLPLSSGNFAVFGPNRKLYTIVSAQRIRDFFLLDRTFWTWIGEQAAEPRRVRSPANDIGDIDI